MVHHSDKSATSNLLIKLQFGLVAMILVCLKLGRLLQAVLSLGNYLNSATKAAQLHRFERRIQREWVRISCVVIVDM